MSLHDRRQFIIDSVRSIVGYPVINTLDVEVATIDFDDALLRYYQAAPIIRTRTYDVTFNQETLIPIDQVLELEFPSVLVEDESIGTANNTLLSFSKTITKAPIRPGSVIIKRAGTEVANDNSLGDIAGTDGAMIITGSVNYLAGQVTVVYNAAPASGSITVTYRQDNNNYFYLGVLNEAFKSNIIPRYNLDRFLLGVETGFDPVNEYNPLKMAARNTYDHMLSGQTTIEYRHEEGTKGVLHVIPMGIGTCAITHAFGCVNMDRVPMNHIFMFGNLVAEKFIERVISVRSGIQLSADYQINTSYLEKKLAELHEENIRALAEIATPVVLWG